MPVGCRGVIARLSLSALGLLGSGCPSNTFSCLDDAACTDAGSGPGRCEATGFCSFPDAACASGRRYGGLAGGGLAGACVDGDEATSTTTDPTTSTPPSTTATTDTTESSTSTEGSETRASTEASSDSTDPTGVPSCPGWWNCDWSRRRAVRVGPLDLARPLTNVPIPLSLPPPSLEDGSLLDPDLRIVGPDGLTWAYEREGDVLWIRVPTVPADAELSAWAYYDNPAADDGEQATEVWDLEYSGVWHLSDALDSTAFDNDGDPVAVTHEPGPLGAAARFDGATSSLEIQPSASLTDLPDDGLTLEAWFRIEADTTTTFGRLFDGTDDTLATLGWALMVSSGSLPDARLQLDRGYSITEVHYSSAPFDVSTWVHVAATLDADQAARMWVDGEELSVELLQAPEGTPGSDASAPHAIGSLPTGVLSNRTFDGLIDELRVTRGLRSPAWIQASYRVAQPDAVSLGPAESAPTR